MSTRRKRRRGSKIDRRLLILLSITPIGCLVAILLGLLVAWYYFPTRFVNAQMSELSPDYADEVVIMAAADYAEHGDLGRAEELLAELEVPNTAQYVSLVAERLIRTNRGPVDQDIKNVVNLADALGVSTISMIVYVSTPTATPTETPIATETPLPTATPTNTRVVEAEAPAAAEGPAEPEAPTDTPMPEPTATNPPQLAATNTPVPPTDTPEPTATPNPEFDFVIKNLRMLSKDENGGCLGNHSIFINVIDAAGNPLRGVQIGDTWNNPGPVTGHKGEDQPGMAIWDLYKNGFHVLVKSDPSAGREVTSEVTPLLSSNDWEIGIPRLIEAGYCPDEGTCRVLWNSGVFGEGHNSLCWGHYSWEVVFQRTW